MFSSGSAKLNQKMLHIYSPKVKYHEVSIMFDSFSTVFKPIFMIHLINTLTKYCTLDNAFDKADLESDVRRSMHRQKERCNIIIEPWKDRHTSINEIKITITRYWTLTKSSYQVFISFRITKRSHFSFKIITNIRKRRILFTMHSY